MVNTTHYIDDKHQRPTTLQCEKQIVVRGTTWTALRYSCPSKKTKLFVRTESPNGHPKYIDMYVQN